MKTYKIIKEYDDYIVERKDKRTGNRVLVTNKDGEVILFASRTAASQYIGGLLAKQPAEPVMPQPMPRRRWPFRK